jgi:hypothetical protein
MAVTWARLCALARELPEVEEDFWFGTPALKVRGKSFTRLKEDGRTVVFITESVDEQEGLCESRPAIYFITDHYRGYPAVLARLAALDAGEARVRLERGWRQRAPRTLVKQLDGGPPARAPAKAKAAERPKRGKPAAAQKTGPTRSPPAPARTRSATSGRGTSPGARGTGSGAGTRAGRATPAPPATGRRR